jgi:hypothetical protein
MSSLRKLNIPPSDPMPKEYEVIKQKQQQEEASASQLEVELPPKLSHLDFDKLTVLKSKVKRHSARQKEEELKAVLAQVIEYLGDELEANKKELVLYVMMKLERFILKKGQGPLKKSIAVKVLAPLFDGNEATVGLYVDALMSQHVQIKTVGRLALRAFRFFFSKE